MRDCFASEVAGLGLRSTTEVHLANGRTLHNPNFKHGFHSPNGFFLNNNKSARMLNISEGCRAYLGHRSGRQLESANSAFRFLGHV